MFNSVIDAVQTAQKTIVNTVVTNEEIAKPMVKMIDSQCETAKLVSKAGMDIATVLASQVTEQAHNVLKFDFTKFADAWKPVTTAAKK